MKKMGLSILLIGLFIIGLSCFMLFANDDNKKDNGKDKENNEVKEQCAVSFKDKNFKKISYELSNGEKISVDILDCVTESSNEFGKLYSSKKDDYSVQLRMWETDILTLDNIFSYNYSILEGSSGAYLTSDPFQTESGVNYNLVQAFQLNDKEEIILRHHAILYPISDNVTVSIDFSYNMEELDVEYFKNVANSIEV